MEGTVWDGLVEDIPMGLAQLAGMGAGLGTGYLASFPLDKRYQNQLVKKSLAETRKKDEALHHWKTMLDLYKGKITLEDLPLEDRAFYTEQLKVNAKELEQMARSPRIAKNSLEEMGRGRLVPLFPDGGKAKMTRDFQTKVHAPGRKPLMGALSIAGFLGGGDLYRRWENNREDYEKRL